MFSNPHSDHGSFSAIANIPVRICNYGRVPYCDGLDMLDATVLKRMKNEIPNTLLLLEHPPTYTLGMRGKMSHLLTPQSELKSRNINVHRIDRGGDITFHGPGQLVGYPVLDMKKMNLDIRQYIEKLENVIIRSIAGFGISASRVAGFPGAWVDNDKIAAIGVKINAAGISSHGFAINANTDLAFFNNIIPCGLHDKKVTSLAEITGHPIDMAQMRRFVEAAFISEFET